MKEKLKLPKSYLAAEQLEDFLGDPMDPTSKISFKRSAELDEKEEFPTEFIGTLDDWGFHKYLVPSQYGGNQRSFEELMALVRVVARRDLTIAESQGATFLASTPVWIAGTENQKQRQAELILNRGKMGFAVTESDHGHHILANDTHADKVDEGYTISGEKWAFGNAEIAKGFAVHARTGNRGGPRDYSMFFLEKDALTQSQISQMPQTRTWGLRGFNLKGMRFNKCLVPSDALIGEEGRGFELAIKSNYASRTFCGALSLGAADTALRVVVNYVSKRKLYGDTVVSIPHVRSTLAEAFLDIIIGECVSISAARAWHVSTRQMSLWAAIVKYFVPVSIEETMRNLSVVMGARFFMRDTPYWGAFQKALRDSAIISVFDGNTVTQLNSIGLQLPLLLTKEADDDISNARLNEKLASIFTLANALPAVDLKNLHLHCHGSDDSLQGIELALIQLRKINSKSLVEDSNSAEILELCELLLEEREKLRELVRACYPVRDKSAELAEFGRRYCTLHAAASCIHLWMANQERMGEFFAKGDWLVLALDKLLKDKRPSRGFCDPEKIENMLEQILILFRENGLFSLVPLQLGTVAQPEINSSEETLNL